MADSTAPGTDPRRGAFGTRGGGGRSSDAKETRSFYLEPSVPDRVARKLSRTRAALLRDEDSHRAVGVLGDGASIVATPSALIVVDDDAIRARHAWHEIDRITFSGEDATVRVHLVEDAGRAIPYTLAGNVPAVAAAIKERVDASVVHVDRLTTSDGTVVRVALRRDEEGRIYSQVTALGTPRLTPQDQARIDDLELRVRQTVGLDVEPSGR